MPTGRTRFLSTSKPIQEVIKGNAWNIRRYLKEYAPYRTGALKKSISVRTQRNKWVVTMNEYGAYLDKLSPKWEGWIVESVESVLDAVAKDLAKNIAKTL